MTLYFLRHAEKENGDYFNPILGHQDPPLSPFGKAQSESVRRFFAEKGISSIYVSDYLRTRQTAEPLASHLDLAPFLDQRLNEIDTGLIEGLDDETVERNFPDVWSAYIARTHDFRFPHGETGSEAKARIVEYIAQMSHSSQNILAVSHDGIIRALFCHVVGLPVYKRFDFHMDFCGVLEIEYAPREQKWRLIRFNQPIPAI
jgi:broad specificity phosphatase PhoE